ncbi:MAG: uracil-DNA glycosylase [Acholeplasmataceae bacterium]|nr:uracil-DNA glycosylase [Acholeplasmataceae bacterium]
MSFAELIRIEAKKPYFINLLNNLRLISQTEIIHPKQENWFKALVLTPLENVKVVILGQDPYYNPHQANGLCFSVNKGVSLPPSLRNIYQVIEEDYQIKMAPHGDLTSWATEGVLLLNTVLTVSEGKPLSHQNLGWLTFTNEVIKLLQTKDDIVYILLGSYAQSYTALITNKTHVVLKSSHPSPLSSYRGFMTSHIFMKANQELMKKNINPVNWVIK